MWKLVQVLSGRNGLEPRRSAILFVIGCGVVGAMVLGLLGCLLGIAVGLLCVFQLLSNSADLLINLWGADRYTPGFPYKSSIKEFVEGFSPRQTRLGLHVMYCIMPENPVMEAIVMHHGGTTILGFTPAFVESNPQALEIAARLVSIGKCEEQFLKEMIIALLGGCVYRIYDISKRLLSAGIALLKNFRSQ